VYRILAVGLGGPTPDLVASVVDGELVDVLGEAVAWLGADAAAYTPALDLLSSPGATRGGASLEDYVDELSVEHARLFTGPGRPAVMCYASQYLDADERGPGRLNGAAAAYAAAAYRAQNVAAVPKRGELPDHATLELEFLFHLCRREQASWEAGDGDDALTTRRALDAFLREHAGRWLPDFAASLQAATTFAVYAGLARLLAIHVSIELGQPASIADAGPPA
jgi:TorA maturation chaperone TorD